MKRILFAAAAFAVVATAAYAAPTVKTVMVTLPGTAGSANVMTDDKGMVLYTFTRDTAGAAKTSCAGTCATNWPPFIAAAGATAGGDWTIVDGTDKNGTTAIKQWAYKGMPVYYYARDTMPSQATGEGAGGNTWHVIKM
jgi:predicted lipoprotein with Yx(FWY)xxD motif